MMWLAIFGTFFFVLIMAFAWPLVLVALPALIPIAAITFARRYRDENEDVRND